MKKVARKPLILGKILLDFEDIIPWKMHLRAETDKMHPLFCIYEKSGRILNNPPTFMNTEKKWAVSIGNVMDTVRHLLLCVYGL